MKAYFAILLLAVSVFSTLIAAQSVLTPPRGWNSYDSFTWVITEQEYLGNVDVQAKALLPFGYEFAVIDYLWFQDLAPPNKINIDSFGRAIPATDRWTSSTQGRGFKPVGDYVHKLGLKFGIHIMRGISQAAVDANSPILGTQYRARDIALTSERCPWHPDWMSVNVSHPGGQAYFNSLFSLYASWGVDFIKNDCIFASNYVEDNIVAASTAINLCGRPMVYSLSPGGEPQELGQAQKIHPLVNMYRISGDDWDNWSDLKSHFDIIPPFATAGLIGASGKNGKSFPDLDMLPLGWISSPSSSNGPFKNTSLTKDEQRTQVTLWSIAKSPLMFGGDMRRLDSWTLSLLTNPNVLEVDDSSSNNRQLWSKDNGDSRCWIAEGKSGETIIALFNIGDKANILTFSFSDIKKSTCLVKDLWENVNLGSFTGTFSRPIPIHGTGLYSLTNCQ